MNKYFKILFTVGVLLSLVIVGLYYFKTPLKTTQSKEEVSLNKILQEQFDNKYKTIVTPANNYLITLITTPCPYGDSPFGDTCGFSDKRSPLIVIQEFETKKIQSIFEVGFKHSNKDKLNTGNNIILANQTFTNEKFKDFSFLTEWFIWWGGSSGFKGMAMFAEQGDQLLPVNGYFGETSSESNLTLTDKLTGKTYTFPVITDSYFTEYKDLNKDGKTDLLYAEWIWDLPNESHYEARPWYLQVYELNNNRFEVAPWWNNGEEYKTEENIGYEKKDKLKLFDVFNTVYQL